MKELERPKPPFATITNRFFCGVPSGDDRDRISALEMAFQDWAEWPEGKRQEIMERVVAETIRQIMPIMLRSIGCDEVADQCREDGSVTAVLAASDAAHAAYASGGSIAIIAAANAAVASVTDDALYNSATAATATADVAGFAADVVANQILRLACTIWIEAATRKEREGKNR